MRQSQSVIGLGLNGVMLAMTCNLFLIAQQLTVVSY